VSVGAGTGVFGGGGTGVFGGGGTGVFGGGGTGVSVGAGTGVSVGAATGVSVGVATGVSVGVATGVSVGVATGVSVGVGADQHITLETLLLSIVTAPFLASALPSTPAPVVRVMLVSARIFPTNAVPVPRVAELPTCQKTLHRSPPLIMPTDELLAVVSVLPIWKTQTDRGSPWALSVRIPVNCADDEKQ